jgi:hypothetical protein
MRLCKTSLWALLVALLAACTGETTSRVPGTDGTADEVAQEADSGPPPACSANGEPADCDPVTGGGCGSATCYLVKNQGPSCVCKKGSTEGEEACNTTIECGAGMVCAGTKAPGVCRSVCRPGEGGCLSTTTNAFCRVIDALPSYGYCDLAK